MIDLVTGREPRRNSLAMQHLCAAGIVLALAWCGGCAPAAPEAEPQGPHTEIASAPPPSIAEPGPSTRQWRQIGRSVEGRPIEALTVGEGPTRVLVIGSIHGDEIESLDATDALVDLLDDAEVTVRIVRDLNPDGTARGRRTNANGVDLNRNFPASNFSPSRARGLSPLSEPESAALAVELDLFGPDVVVVCHSIRSGPFVNFDGPGAELAGVFADAAQAVDSRWRVVPDMGYGTPGSLGSFVGVDRQIAILTIEQDRGEDPAVAAEALIAGVLAIVEALP